MASNIKQTKQQDSHIIIYISLKQKLIKLSMYGENLDYLSRTTPSSPMVQKKSPYKYLPAEPKYIEPYIMNKSLSHPSTQDWSASDFQNLRKVADDVGNLRQTFDGRSQSKIQQILSKYDYDNQESVKAPGKGDLNLRQTFNTRPRFIDNYQANSGGLGSGDAGRAQREARELRENRNMRSPMRADKIQIQYNKYKEQLEELETTKKMAEELRKLKEDRKKRLEGGSKEPKQNYKPEQSSDFKRKKYQQFYSPKYQKIDIGQNLQISKTMPLKKLNLQQYKSSADEKPQSSSYLPHNIEEQPMYKSKTLLDIPDVYSSPTKGAKEPTNAKPPASSLRKKSVSQVSYATNNLIDQFMVGKFLGEGRFGTVHQVLHKPTGAIFAMKKIPKQNVTKLNMVNQLILQLKIQTYLHHHNIVTLYHSFDDNIYIYLIMQYMEQGTLFSQLKKKKTLPESEVAEKIKQISSAIKYLHENQIAHRDIKPQNIVITHGVCKLCDFGWATLCDSRRRTCCGTLDYTPPEIFEGEEYDQTVDLWCLGVLTYELLVGKAPFYHIRREQTKNRILSVEKTAINYPENLSKKAVSFIDSLLKKDPTQRLSSEDLLDHPFLQIKQQDL